MKKRLLPILMPLLALGQLKAQTANQPEILWKKNLGSQGAEGFYSSILSSNNKIVSIGYSLQTGGDVTQNYGASDVWVVKTNLNGNIEWQKSYGGSQADIGRKIIETQDGGFLIVADTYSADGDVSENKGASDIWVIKINAQGDIQWQRAYGGSQDDKATGITESADGYLIVGYTRSQDGNISENKGNYDAWFFKIDKTGHLLWEKTFGGSKIDAAFDCTTINNTGYAIALESISDDGDIQNPIGSYDVWILKLNESGNIIFRKNFGGSKADNARHLSKTQDGGFILAGFSHSIFSGNHNNGHSDFWFMKITEDGSVQWQKTYGGSDAEYAYSIKETSNGEFFIVGNSNSNDGDIPSNKGGRDSFVAKLNKNGEIIWKQNYGGESADELFSILPREDNNEIILSGRSRSTQGDIQQNKGYYDAWLLSLKDPESLAVSEAEPAPTYKVFPSIFREKISVQGPLKNSNIKIWSTSGQMVYLKQQINGSKAILDLSSIPKGIYLLQIDQNKSIKIIKD